MTWLDTASLIQMLPTHGARKPYPLSWEDQTSLLHALPDHLARMALLKVNTGRRVLNRITKSVVESMRGDHPTHLFSYQGHPVTKMNNSAWKRIRVMVGLKQVRVHDWKHTFGRRLRAAGVPLETRKVLLGHRNGDITSHYSAPELEELLEAANRVCEG